MRRNRSGNIGANNSKPLVSEAEILNACLMITPRVIKIKPQRINKYEVKEGYICSYCRLRRHSECSSPKCSCKCF